MSLRRHSMYCIVQLIPAWESESCGSKTFTENVLSKHAKKMFLTRVARSNAICTTVHAINAALNPLLKRNFHLFFFDFGLRLGIKRSKKFQLEVSRVFMCIRANCFVPVSVGVDYIDRDSFVQRHVFKKHHSPLRSNIFIPSFLIHFSLLIPVESWYLLF